MKQSHSPRIASAFRDYGRAILDLVLIALALVVVYFLISGYDLFESFNKYSREHEDWELDELLVAVLLSVFGLIAFGARRLQDQRREIKARHQAERRAQHLALADTLTGLANRRRFEAQLSERLAALAKDGGHMALMMIDLDRFKPVNDVFGHATGDQVLIAFARRASALLDGRGLLARLGGDEFAVLLSPLVDEEEPSRLGRRLIALVEQPLDAGGTSVSLGASIGIAVAPQDGLEPDELIRRADIALYRAKASGRGRFHFFEADMDAQVKRRAQIEMDLRRAINEGTIRPFYQPIVNLETREIIGFEALARWTHHEFGELAPEQFIGIAEDSGLITQLSFYLLRCACRDAVAWPSEIKLAFNLSRMQLADPMLVLRTLQVLGETGLNPNRLEMEISESALVTEIVAAKEALKAFHEAGIRIALDDFGTGNSSLNHLRECNFDRLKIDRSFIHSMADSEADAAFIRAIVGLCNALGLPVTAEGIEDDTIVGPLLAEGCLEGQGFSFGKAVSAEEALGLLNPNSGQQAIA